MTSSPQVGSDAWMGADNYEEEYSERITRFVNTVNQEGLIAFASGLHGNLPCTVSREFSVGNFNLVRKIRFDDGVEWIARLRMPPMPDQDGGAVSPIPEKIHLEMESELATMDFVRQNTDIPIPKVYAYDVSDQNAIGCPFSIMEYVHGNTAEEMSRAYPGDHEGIPPQFEERFWRQVASIMIQLASIRMPKIGSITRTEREPASFGIGPLVETGTGPYNSAAEFYADYPAALGKILGAQESPVESQTELLQAFQSLAAGFSSGTTRTEGTPASGFGLANFDLNPNNFIVDSGFNVLAVIDWDAVVAVPDAPLYRLPFLMGIDCAVPGEIDTHPAVVKRQRLGLHFAETVEAAGRRLDEDDSNRATRRPIFVFRKAGFFSKEAVAFRSLTFCKMKQDWVNAEWLMGLKWMSEHDEVAVSQFYLQDQDQ